LDYQQKKLYLIDTEQRVVSQTLDIEHTPVSIIEDKEGNVGRLYIAKPEVTRGDFLNS